MTLPDVTILNELGEYFAAGYFELPGQSPMIRWSRAIRRQLENQTLPEYHGTSLYCWLPEPQTNQLMSYAYWFTWQYFADRCQKRIEESSIEQHRQTLQALHEIMVKEDQQRMCITTVHICGGRNITHSIPNYGRVLREGLDRHEQRISQNLQNARQQDRAEERVDFYNGLLDVMAGMRAFHKRLVAHLQAYQSEDARKVANRDRLVAALARVPFQPAEDFYQAVVAYHYTWLIDGADNPGRMDCELNPFYLADLQAGKITHEQAVELIHLFNSSVSDCRGWSAAIGGRGPNGKADFNEMTEICIEASHGLIRPSFELRVTKEMPDKLWDISFDALATGCGQPAFYNEDLYRKGLRELNLGISEHDLSFWNGGGCSETMIHGCSNVGSIEVGIHLLLLLEEHIQKELVNCESFEQFVDSFKKNISDTINEMCRQVYRQQKLAAQVRPQPVRSILIDDCIDSGVEYNAGGARYNWSVVNMAGLSNVADSLAAMKEVVFDRKELTKEKLLEVLEQNFDQNEHLRQRLLRCPHFGNDDPYVDQLASEIFEYVCDEFALYAPWRGGKYVPSCIMFETYATYGKMVGATPDGRLAHEALADSIGPVQGRDTNGPTAMLKSITKLPLRLAVGTPVLNVRFNRNSFSRMEDRQRIRKLIETYFEMGGMQMQVSVLDAETLKDAVEHPEQHENLIVRIGGYSTYFNGLSDDLKQMVIQRTEHLV